MKNEFLFQLERMGHLMNLRELEGEMNQIISERVRGDFSKMDKIIVRVFDNRQPESDASPPLKSLGKMPLDVAIQKFR
jgi:hypothetical protein